MWIDVELSLNLCGENPFERRAEVPAQVVYLCCFVRKVLQTKPSRTATPDKEEIAKAVRKREGHAVTSDSMRLYTNLQKLPS